jgi:hypothetical protein
MSLVGKAANREMKTVRIRFDSHIIVKPMSGAELEAVSAGG